MTKTVLVIDDNEILLHAWRKILQAEDLTAVVTTDPAEGLEWIKKGPIDLLVCDIVMPQMDGFELLRHVRALAPDLKVILTTGYACDFGQLEKLSDRNIQVLLKPYDNLNKVLKFIRETLEDTENAYDKTPIPSDHAQVHLWRL